MERAFSHAVNASLNSQFSSARYNRVTAELRRMSGSRFQFQLNYTLSFDKSDDNERDPFLLRYARADALDREYNWSDRDQRHRVNAWFLAILPGDFNFSNRQSLYSPQPSSQDCTPSVPGAVERATLAADRICADGTILQRNTLRRDNGYFSWDVRLSKPFNIRRGTVEAIIEVFTPTTPRTRPRAAPSSTSTAPPLGPRRAAPGSGGPAIPVPGANPQE